MLFGLIECEIHTIVLRISLGGVSIYSISFEMAVALGDTSLGLASFILYSFLIFRCILNFTALFLLSQTYLNQQLFLCPTLTSCYLLLFAFLPSFARDVTATLDLTLTLLQIFPLPISKLFVALLPFEVDDQRSKVVIECNLLLMSRLTVGLICFLSCFEIGESLGLIVLN